MPAGANHAVLQRASSLKRTVADSAVGRVEADAVCLQGLIVDVPDVIHDSTCWRRWLLRLLAQLGVRPDYEEFFGLWDARYLRDVHCGRREGTEAFQTFLLQCGLSWAQIDEVEGASRIQLAKLEHSVRPWPGVVSTITRLSSQGVALAAWADAPYAGSQLASRLDRWGIGHCFRAALTSFDVEETQPSPAVYQRMVEALGIQVARVAYLGHDADHLKGATDAHLRTIAFNHQEQTPAAHCLTRFDELCEIFRGSSSHRGVTLRPTTPNKSGCTSATARTL